MLTVLVQLQNPQTAKSRILKISQSAKCKQRRLRALLREVLWFCLNKFFAKYIAAPRRARRRALLFRRKKEKFSWWKIVKNREQSEKFSEEIVFSGWSPPGWSLGPSRMYMQSVVLHMLYHSVYQCSSRSCQPRYFSDFVSNSVMKSVWLKVFDFECVLWFKRAWPLHRLDAEDARRGSATRSF